MLVNADSAEYLFGAESLPFLVFEALDAFKHCEGSVAIYSFVVIIKPKIFEVDEEAKNRFEYLPGCWDFVQCFDKNVEINIC